MIGPGKCPKPWPRPSVRGAFTPKRATSLASVSTSRRGGVCEAAHPLKVTAFTDSVHLLPIGSSHQLKRMTDEHPPRFPPSLRIRFCDRAVCRVGNLGIRQSQQPQRSDVSGRIHVHHHRRRLEHLCRCPCIPHRQPRFAPENDSEAGWLSARERPSYSKGIGGIETKTL